MKDNCLFIFDRPTEKHEEVLLKLDPFFRQLSSTHYIYVADPSRSDFEDSPSGARYLRWTENAINAFGELSAVVVADNEDLYQDLRKKLPSSVRLISIQLAEGIDEPTRRIAEQILAASLQTCRAPL